jgi:hypothetical protein
MSLAEPPARPMAISVSRPPVAQPKTVSADVFF